MSMAIAKDSKTAPVTEHPEDPTLAQGPIEAGRIGPAGEVGAGEPRGAGELPAPLSLDEPERRVPGALFSIVPENAADLAVRCGPHPGPPEPTPPGAGCL